MKRFIFGIILVLNLLLNSLYAEVIHFVSIEKLVEQRIGEIIVHEIFKKAGIDITITPFPGMRAQSEAVSGRMDGEIMRIFSYGEEHPSTQRVPTPYYYLETMAFIRKGSGFTINRKEDLTRYKIGKVRGVKHTDNITAGLHHVLDVNTTEEMMKLLDSGRIDVALTNSIDGEFVIREFGYINIISCSEPLAREDLYIYLNTELSAIIPEIDSVIRNMTESGEMDRVIENAEKQVLVN